MFLCISAQELISVNKLILIQKATFRFWNELGHLKPIIETFVLIIAINKTHPCLKSIRMKYRVNKIK